MRVLHRFRLFGFLFVILRLVTWEDELVYLHFSSSPGKDHIIDTNHVLPRERRAEIFLHISPGERCSIQAWEAASTPCMG
ncbi:hypothetical protein B0T21DRAFT_370766 [Apiosordaria backusii]|uniref:Secreted protein n=1 Tax=Apiosordaria backusii TaxID=314023 RepID=A0AA40B7Y7_9PEZI|nr:hypothetical protein B0T21DRAFT_370766 [Apiosordaria backusii]